MYGLANRLRVLCSFAALARRCGRELYICWTAGEGWSDEDVEDLFENRFPRCSEALFERERERGVCLDAQVTVLGVGGRRRKWRYADGAGVAVAFSPSHPVITYRGCLACDELLAPEDRRRLLPQFDRDFIAELRALRPVRSIRERVAELASEFTEDTVGLHIRRGDAVLDSHIGDHFRRSPNDAFIARIDEILESNPSSTFFLATDCPDTEHHFRRLYGETVLTNREKRFVPSIPGAPKDNQHDAAIDFFTLARTRTLLGTNHSTFSRAAAALGGARFEVVTDDSWWGRMRWRATYTRNQLHRRASAARARSGFRRWH
jgi:hypothetical protein